MAGLIRAIAAGDTDGTVYTYDETGLALAITTLNSAGGGHIYVGPGTLSVTASLGTISAPIRLSGAGGETIFALSGTFSAGMVSVTAGTVGVQFSDFTIQGSAATSGTQIGLQIGGTNTLVRDVLFTGTGTTTGLTVGLYLPSGGSRTKVRGCQFERIVGNQAINGTTSPKGVAILVEQCSDTIIDDCNIVLGSTTGRHGIVVTAYTTAAAENTMIRNNRISGGAASQILLYGQSTSNLVRYTSVENNVCDDATMGSATTGGAIQMESATSGQARATYNTVRNNIVTTSGAYGIQCLLAQDNTIEGNHVYKSQKHGIVSIGSQRCTITNNRVSDNSQAANNTYNGIHLDSVLDGAAAAQLCDSTDISGNHVWNSGATGQKYSLQIVASQGASVSLTIGPNRLDLGVTDAILDASTAAQYVAQRDPTNVLIKPPLFVEDAAAVADILTVTGTTDTVRVDATGDLITSGPMKPAAGITLSAAGNNIIAADSGSGLVVLRAGGLSTNSLAVAANGNVGFGKLNPGASYDVDVAGNGNVDGTWTVGGLLSLNNLLGGVTTITGTSATPTTDKLFAILAQTGATTVTLFTPTSPASGELLIVVASNANTTVQSNANQLLRGGVDWGMKAGDVLVLTSVTGSAANYWVEVSRMSAAGWTAFADADTTPSVRGSVVGTYWLASNTGATSITTFDDGVDGQEITVLATTANTTFVDGATLQLSGSANYNILSGSIVRFKKRSTVWYELGRSVD